MTTQQNVLARAKQGEPDAIAALMNRTLSKKGSRVKIRRRGGEYKLLVESAQAPNKAATVQWIVKGLDSLAIASIETITIYGKAQQSNKPDWQQTVQFPLQSSDQTKRSASGQPVNTRTNTRTDTPKPAPSKTSLSEAPLDLSTYCFTRNKSLLSGDLTLPAKPVIQLVLAFSALNNAQKSEALPHIDVALRKSTAPEDEALSSKTQAWFAQLAALDGPDVRKGSIWLSRYCLHPEATVSQLSPGTGVSVSAAAPETSLTPEDSGRLHPANQPVKSTQSHNKLQSNFPPYAGPGASDKPPSAAVQQAAQRAAQRAVAARRLPTRQQKSPSLQSADTPLTWIIPVAWSVCLMLLMVLGISSASTASAVESSDSYAICNATMGDVQNCTLAVQIVGDEAYFTEIIKGAVPLSPEHREAAIAECSDYINYEAGLYTEAIDTIPTVLSSSSQEIFSGVLLTDVTQKSTLAPDTTLRLACIHHTYTDEFADEFSDSDGAWFEELSSDIIPANWPSEPYAGNVMMAAFSVQDSLGIYNNIIRLFSYPLFTAAGLFVAVSICSAYSCSTVMGLYKAAAVLGVIECFIAMLPIGWFLTLSLEILALGLTAQAVSEFDVEIQSGYGALAFGTISLIVVRGILLSILSFVLYAITTSLVIAPAITSTL